MKVTNYLFFSLAFIGGFIFVDGISLLQSPVYVIDGGSFFQRVIVNDKSIRKCSASFEEDGEPVNVQLDVNSTNAIFDNGYTDHNNLTKRLTSLGGGYCGFRIDKSSSSDPSQWLMHIIDSTNETQSISFTVYHYSVPILHSAIEVTLGSSTTIECGSQTSSQYICMLYNPKNELLSTSEKCAYLISSVTLEDIGVWRCTVNAIQSFEPLIYQVNVTRKELTTSEGWAKDEGDFLSIGCQIKNLKLISTPDHCTLISPAGNMLPVRPGSATERYTTFKTNLSALTCGIEIKKPLQDNEMGIWRCDISDRGYIIKVGNKPVPPPEAPLVVTELGQSFTVKCTVSYTSDHCFLISPNGTRFLPNSQTRVQLGECSKTISRSDKTYDGTWKCYFIKENEATTHVVEAEVLIRNAVTCSNKVSASRSSDIVLSCNTGRVPFRYCWFISPKQEMYQMRSNLKTDRFSYVGRGIEYGDCGIKISEVTSDDAGNWTCVTSLSEYVENYHTLTLHVESSETALAISLGVTIPIAIIALFFGIFVVWKKFRTQHTADERVPITSVSSLTERSQHDHFH